MKKILSLEDAYEEDDVGSKAASLAAVSETSKVPQGFVVTDQAMKDFLERNGISDKILSILSRTKIDDRRELKDASREIFNLFENFHISHELKNEIEEAYKNFVISSEAKKAGRKAMELIKAGRDNPPVVVRSSPKRDGNLSPSIYRSSMNVKGNDNLIKEIKESWKSFFSPGAIYYREKRGYPHDLSFGVLVQKMIVPDKTFAYLERDPCNPERSVLEGIYGFGELMFRGEVVPDIYFFDQNGSLVDKKTNRREWVQEKNPSTGDIEKQPSSSSKKDRPVLKDREASELASSLRKVTSRFGSSVAVEFCTRNGDFFVLDVMTLKNTNTMEREGQNSDVLSKGFGVSPGKVSGEVTRSERNSEEKILVKNLTSVFDILTKRPSALLTTSGGFSSRQAKITRELEIPSMIIEDPDYSSLSEGKEVVVDTVEGVVFSHNRTKHEADGMQWDSETSSGGSLMAHNIDSITATELIVLTNSENFDPERFDDVEGCVVLVDGSNVSSMNFGISRERGLSDKLSRWPKEKELWLKPEDSDGGMSRVSELLGTIDRSPENTNVLLSVNSFKDLDKKINSLGIPDETEVGLVVDTPEMLLSLGSLGDTGADLYLLDFESLVDLFFGHTKGRNVFSSKPFWSSIEDFCDTCREEGSKVAVSDVADKGFLMKLIENGVDTILVRPNKVAHVKNTVARIEKKLLLERMR